MHLINAKILSRKELYTAEDETAFEAVFRTHYGVLCNYACSFLDDRDEAEEIVQTAFVACWEKRLLPDVHTSVKAYLFAMVRNSCLNSLNRKKMLEKYAEEKKRSAPSSDGTQPLEQAELKQHIAVALKKLPEQCRVIFAMSRFEDMKYAEIATELNLSVKTVENQIGKALKMMREQLREYLPMFLVLMIDNLIR